MENKKFNIAEILKNAPKGLELYSPLFGACTFDSVVPSTQPTDDVNAECIHVKYRGRDWYFNEYGECFYENSECLLFPSQSYRTWNSWQTVLLPKSVGSVVNLDSIGTKFIIQKSGLAENAEGLYLSVTNRVETCRLQYCDEQETKLYMTLLNENGKMWSSSEEKIVWISDKYKKGDTLLLMTNAARHQDMLGCEVIVFSEVDDRYSSILYFKRNRNDALFTRVKVTNEELVNDFVNVGNDLESPTFEDVVTEGMKVADEELCNDTFTIADFKPFDKVIVRGYTNMEWRPDFFERWTGVGYTCIGSTNNSMCVPYNDETKHLLFTKTDYEGKYKTWK